MIEHRKLVTCQDLNDYEYETIEQLSTEILKIYDEIIKRYETTYSIKDYKFEYNITTTTDYDSSSSYINVEVYRSETPDEVELRLEKEAKIIKKKEEEERAVQLKETRLQLAQDDPDFIAFTKLHEKFKDIL